MGASVWGCILYYFGQITKLKVDDHNYIDGRRGYSIGNTNLNRVKVLMVLVLLVLVKWSTLLSFVFVVISVTLGALCKSVLLHVKRIEWVVFRKMRKIQYVES